MASRRCLIIFSSTASTWVSSSVVRSSTSRCLIAASASRMVASRSLSPARIALFMSSVRRSLSAIACAAPLTGGAHAVARHTLHVALDGRGLLALALLGGFLVELAPAQLGENAGLLTGALEAPQGGIEVLILTNSNARHRNLKSLIGMGSRLTGRTRGDSRVAPGEGDAKGARGQRQRRAAHDVGLTGARRPFALLGDAAAVQHPGGVRVHLQRRIVVGDGAVVVALAQVHKSATVEEGGVVGPQAQRLVAVGERAVELLAPLGPSPAARV